MSKWRSSDSAEQQQNIVAEAKLLEDRVVSDHLEEVLIGTKFQVSVKRVLNGMLALSHLTLLDVYM